MASEKLYFRLLLHVAVILCSALLFAFLWNSGEYLISSLLILVLIVFQGRLLFRLLNRSNRDMKRLMDSIEYNDFTAGFSLPPETVSDPELYAKFQKVISRFRTIKSEKENYVNYLHQILQNLNTAVFVCDAEENIILSNAAFHHILYGVQVQKLSDLSHLHVNLPVLIRSTRKGIRTTLVFTRNHIQMQFTVQVNRIIVQEVSCLLVSLQNIQNELEAKELLSWQKLMRVMTHEIMNSVTPVISLAGSARALVQPASGSSPVFSEEVIQDLSLSLYTIENRGRGLLSFVQAYRALLKMPMPYKTRFQLLPALESVIHLMCSGKSYQIKVEVHPVSLSVYADQSQWEQVMINLIKNAEEASPAYMIPDIQIRAWQRDERIQLEISDKGCGISPEMMDQVFIPFFTTKSGGSGIGLSVCRQILHAHNGELSMSSAQGQGTRVLLSFPE